ncbi:23291_t:CDS:1, partial [Dentiscutata erythropus]
NIISEFNNMSSELLISNEIPYLTEINNLEATDTIEDQVDNGKKLVYPITLKIDFKHWAELDR